MTWEKITIHGITFHGLRRDPGDHYLYLRDAFLPDDYSPFHILPGVLALSTGHWCHRGFDIPPPVEVTVERPKFAFLGSSDVHG